MTDPNTPPGATPPPSEPVGATPPAAPAYDAPPPAAPAYSSAPPAEYGSPAAGEPGKTMGIVALIAVFFISILGLVLGYVARSQSKKAGIPNTPAKIAIILGWIFIVLQIIGAIIAIVLFATLAASGTDLLCEGMPPGVYELTDGGTITCE
ncbi:DUF4190 domain-containing protein [Planococcus sp. APC 4015]|nr:DUF4190 domain-containing protein [Planococcus sp. APC 4015]